METFIIDVPEMPSEVRELSVRDRIDLANLMVTLMFTKTLETGVDEVAHEFDSAREYDCFTPEITAKIGGWVVSQVPFLPERMFYIMCNRNSEESLIVADFLTRHQILVQLDAGDESEYYY